MRLKLFLFCVFLGCSAVRAQQTDSLKGRLQELLSRYKAGSLQDTDYLRGVDAVAPLLVKNDSLVQLLGTYREVAFNDPVLGKYRAFYYTYLALNAYNLNKLGSSIYYSEKNNEERVKTGQFEKDGLAHSDLFAMSVYTNNRDYPRVFAKYANLEPVIKALPETILQGGVSPEQVFVAGSILETVVSAACEAKDSVRAMRAMGLLTDVMNGVEHYPVKYKDRRLLYDYLLARAQYVYQRFLGHYEQAEGFLKGAIRVVQTAGFQAHLQSSYLEGLLTDAVDFYFLWNKRDSARSYLGLLKKGDGKVKYSFQDPAFLPESESRLLAGEGKYEQAYKQLRQVYQLRDSAYYAVSSDKDNNLYALAESENIHTELLRAEERKRAAEKSSIVLFFLLVLLVIAAGVGFWVYRSAQQRRMLDLRLQLARNFHDEIGPMLLYANVLAKKEKVDELKVQIGKVMEAVRGIAHDLKTTELNTIGSFGKAVRDLLKRMQDATHIDYFLQVANSARILSTGQVSHLQAIVQELVSNSIKHADCGKIYLRVGAPDKSLQIRYSDDGKGMEPGRNPGIGLQNMNERVALLKGKFELSNSWPEGYSIDISIPLV